ncbi:ABC transporter ATP-binding protein [Pseudonocardia sp. EC080625-04]|uniref:ABC transporter ATP-binding protein n=1 Tax=Pseudonocardia sp. EC080625-04 TaxID=1096868 RepID=UPI0007619EB8|nr:ATP-binding cassette domain-containing protein [Pseudonocardia sp. EC080625-04]
MPDAHRPGAPLPGRRPDPAGPAVEFRDVTTMLDETPVLFRLGLSLDPGTVTVVMGPSGAGKTTLVRHLAGLVAPGRGTVTVAGADVWTAGEAELRRIRRGMSVLFGGSSVFESSLFGSLSAYENVTYALDGRGLDPGRVERIAMHRLREMGLHDRADALPGELPAHGRKRLAIARTLAVGAPVLVLDELETGLDATYAATVVAAVREQHERSGATVLVTTHDVELARALADTVAILCHGRIVAAGPPSELLRGVHDADEFDRRFRLSDLLGPPDPDATRAELDGGRKRSRTIELDPRTVAPALLLIAVVTSYCLFLLLTR